MIITIHTFNDLSFLVNTLSTFIVIMEQNLQNSKTRSQYNNKQQLHDAKQNTRTHVQTRNQHLSSFQENLLGHPQIKSANIGSVRISINSNLNKHFAKSTNDLTSIDNFTKPSTNNRITINIPPSLSNNEKKADTPNGILKNCGGTHLAAATHKGGSLHQKTITFGEK